jgi:CRISPR/Cas system-associated exonuclease Cas4 (RecB family)
VVGGKPDLIGTKTGSVVVVDAKGGKKNIKDPWQVRIYLALLPLAKPTAFANRPIMYGEIYYSPSDQVMVSLTTEAKQRIFTQIQATGEGDEPVKTPIKRECGWCRVVGCDRKVGAEEMDGSSQGLF